jgi:NLR family CARD domain-containing protein 3
MAVLTMLMGTFNPEGIKAIAGAIGVSTSLTSINLEGNKLGPEGAKALAPALRDSASLTSVRMHLEVLSR